MNEKIEKHLQNIHRELRGSEPELAQGRQESLKYYVHSIHQRLGQWLGAQKDEKATQQYELRWALGLIGVIGVLLAITRSASSDMDWVREHTLAFRLWAVVFCTVFIGVSLERSSVIRTLWGFTITKFLASIILSVLVLCARGKAASYLNGIFHVDASAFPLTLVLTSGLLVLKWLVPFVLIVAAVLSLIHGLIGLGWIKAKLDGESVDEIPLYSFLSFLVSGVILYFGWGWSNDQIADSRMPVKIYLMAHALDFNYSHECANVASSRPVVFLGTGQESVLVAPYKLADFNFAEFFEAFESVPTEFVRQRCDYKPSSQMQDDDQG